MKHLLACLIAFVPFTAVVSQDRDADLPWYILEPVEARIFAYIFLMVLAIAIAWYKMAKIK